MKTFGIMFALLLLTSWAQADILPTPDFTVTAVSIYAEFRPSIEKKQTHIKEKYTGKTVRITGEVKSNRVRAGTHEVTLKANEKYGKAFLKIKKDASEEVLKIKISEKVTLQCVSTGWLIGPAFKDCVPVVAAK